MAIIYWIAICTILEQLRSIYIHACFYNSCWVLVCLGVIFTFIYFHSPIYITRMTKRLHYKYSWHTNHNHLCQLHYTPNRKTLIVLLLVSIITNSCTHSTIFIKNTLKAHVQFTPTCFGTQREPSSGDQHLILAKVHIWFNGASPYSQYCTSSHVLWSAYLLLSNWNAFSAGVKRVMLASKWAFFAVSTLQPYWSYCARSAV